MSRIDRNFGTERIGALSDGVIAIALTLLVLELKIPDVAGAEDLLPVILQQIPQFAGWLISFVFLSVIWHEQHLVFSHIRSCTTGFILITLGQLGAVSLIPFASAVLGDFPDDPDAVTVFSAIMLLNAAFMAANGFYVARHSVLREGCSPALLVRRAVLHLTSGSAAAVVAAVTAYLHEPLFGGFVWLLAPLCLATFHAYGHKQARSREPVAGA
jgi:uncharacterized membrane protein